MKLENRTAFHAALKKEFSIIIFEGMDRTKCYLFVSLLKLTGVHRYKSIHNQPPEKRCGCHM